MAAALENGLIEKIRVIEEKNCAPVRERETLNGSYSLFRNYQTATSFVGFSVTVVDTDEKICDLMTTRTSPVNCTVLTANVAINKCPSSSKLWTVLKRLGGDDLNQNLPKDTNGQDRSAPGSIPKPIFEERKGSEILDWQLLSNHRPYSNVRNGHHFHHFLPVIYELNNESSSETDEPSEIGLVDDNVEKNSITSAGTVEERQVSNSKFRERGNVAFAIDCNRTSVTRKYEELPENEEEIKFDETAEEGVSDELQPNQRMILKNLRSKYEDE